MKPIIHTPHNVLITPTQRVEKIDNKIKRIIEDMKQTLAAADNPKGVGLAATQIGQSLRIFVTRPEETDPIKVYINPVVTWKSKRLVKGIPGKDNRIEGCLSIPQVWGAVKRHEEIKLKYQNEDGTIEEKIFSGFSGTIIQHEVDHLDGILFTRRVLEQKGQLYKPNVNEKGEEILEPLEI